MPYSDHMHLQLRETQTLQEDVWVCGVKIENQRVMIQI